MHGYNGAPHHGGGGYGQGGCVMTPDLTSQPYGGGAGHVMTPQLRDGQSCAPRGGHRAAPPQKDGYGGPGSAGQHVTSARTMRPGQVLCLPANHRRRDSNLLVRATRITPVHATQTCLCVRHGSRPSNLQHV